MTDHYFAPFRSIIKVDHDIKEDNSEDTMIYSYDGNAVQVPTQVLRDHYIEVHTGDKLKIDHEQMATGYREMGQINLHIANENIPTDNEAEQLNINLLKENK